jgi:hypothetical protein
MEKGNPPRETFYDGYVVNAILDAAFLSAKTKKWEHRFAAFPFFGFTTKQNMSYAQISVIKFAN